MLVGTKSSENITTISEINIIISVFYLVRAEYFVICAFRIANGCFYYIPNNYTITSF